MEDNDNIDLNYAIIGLVGKKQSGKDTLAEYLVEEYGYVRYAFADPIKEACQVIFGFTDEQCWGGEKEIMDTYWKVTPRKIFQVFGTELFQYELPKYATELSDIGRSFWVYRFARWYEQQLEKNPQVKIVITDVRFLFEAELIKRLGGMIVNITRTNQLNTDTHASEMEMETIAHDFQILNDSTIQNLHQQADALIGFEF